MQSTLKSLLICLVAILVTGCAYVEYRRVYNIEPKLSAQQREAVGASIEHYFINKGYVLNQKFREYWPDDMYVSVLEIPRGPEQKVREPRLFVLIKQTGIVQLKHSEWFFDYSPFSESKYKPNDIVSIAKEELVAKVRIEAGITVDIRLAEKGYY